MGNCLAFNEFAVRVETFQRAAIKMILKSLHGSRLAYFNFVFREWAQLGFNLAFIKCWIYRNTHKDMHIYTEIYICVFLCIFLDMSPNFRHLPGLINCCRPREKVLGFCGCSNKSHKSNFLRRTKILLVVTREGRGGRRVQILSSPYSSD